MKIVLAIEGMDGAGKSSLARFVQRLCADHGRRCSRIGRRTGYVSPSIAKLTHLLGEENGNLIPHAELYARMARECQRAHLAATAPPGIIVLDRFVLTILALARVYGMDIDLLLPLLRDMVSRADLHATIFRALGISPKLAYEVEKRPFYVTRDGLGKPIDELFT